MAGENFKPNPGTAAVLSFVFNGLGQLYNGQIAKGLSIIFLCALSMLLFIFGSILIAFWLLGKVSRDLLVWGLVLFSVGLILICAFGIYSIIDAFRVAKRLQKC